MSEARGVDAEWVGTLLSDLHHRLNILYMSIHEDKLPPEQLPCDANEVLMFARSDVVMLMSQTRRAIEKIEFLSNDVKLRPDHV
jgi:hypothetical protein